MTQKEQVALTSGYSVSINNRFDHFSSDYDHDSDEPLDYPN